MCAVAQSYWAKEESLVRAYADRGAATRMIWAPRQAADQTQLSYALIRCEPTTVHVVAPATA